MSKIIKVYDAIINKNDKVKISFDNLEFKNKVKEKNFNSNKISNKELEKKENTNIKNIKKNNLKSSNEEFSIIINSAKKEANYIIQKAVEDSNKIIDKSKKDAENIKEEIILDAKKEAEIIKDEADLIKNKAKELEEEAKKIKINAENIFIESEKSLEPKIIELISTLIKKLLSDEVELNPNVISILIKKGIGNVKNIDKINVRISNYDYENAINKKDLILKDIENIENIDFINDCNLKKSDCIVETDFGNVDCSLDLQYEELHKNLYYILKNR